MDHREALAVLGLTDSPDRKSLEQHYDLRRNELAERLANAPTDGLRTKYQSALGDLVAAYTWLNEEREPVPVAGLSRTQMDDLPAASPSYTRGGTAAPQNAPALIPGQVIANRYEIRELIGQGGMGSVYRAFDRTKGEEIALKVMLLSLLASDQAKQRFLSEGKISINLSHPNIVNVFDVQQTGEHFFLTMELLKGQTLRQRLKQSRLTVGEALALAQAVGAALTYAHRFTLHRDVKPENIWIEADGGYKLMDFGIARLLTGSQLTATAAVLGSAYYMAPEQLKDSKAIDGRADEFSLGVVLYEALCGEIPVGRAKSLNVRVKGVPVAMSAAIDRALEANPDTRFPTVQNFVDALAARGFRAIDPKLLRVGGITIGVIALVTLVYVAWPRIGRLLPDSTVAAQQKGDAIQAEATLSELMKRVENQQRDFAERVRDDKSTVDRLTDRVNMSRDQEERQRSQKELSDAQAALGFAQRAQEVAESSILSLDSISALKSQQAVGESQFRDGQFALAAPTLAKARDVARNIIDVSQALEPSIRAQDKLTTRLNYARGVVAQTGGNADEVLTLAATSASTGTDKLAKGDPAGALNAFQQADESLHQAMKGYLEYMVAQYAKIAQERMANNELETAEAAIARGKQLKALEQQAYP